MAYRPKNFCYKLLRRTSGPQAESGEDYDMNTASDVEASAFDYHIPPGRILYFARINFQMADELMEIDKFGGLDALENGCLLEVLDNKEEQVLDFMDGIPIKQNGDFQLLLGPDSPVRKALRGNIDTMPGRFSIFKAGHAMLLFPEEVIRFTVRDDLSELKVFRAMAQGRLTKYVPSSTQMSGD